MKISYNWIKQYINFNKEPEALSEILTNIGLEVEGLEEWVSIEGGLEGIVIGEVLECGPHPNADKLTLTKVDIGSDQALSIVCGAPNVAKGQKVPGTNLPYVVHLSNVAMEITIAALHSDNFNLGLAIQSALLHDTVEDTETTIEEIEKVFGSNVALAVSALTKNSELPKEKQMQDSLTRIKKLDTEVWAVKMADRITNLQPPPPHWDILKKIKYQEEAKVILRELREGNYFLSKRLEEKIEEYENYTNE